MTEERTATAKAPGDWVAINALAFDFADGVVREIGAMSGDHVGSDGTLRYGPHPRLLVHVQLQGTGPRAIRLEFLGVRSFSYDHSLDASPAIAMDLGKGVWRVQVLALDVVAEECHASIIPQAEGLGEGPFILRT